MAHECPECWLVCYCNGDIDDLVLNEDHHMNRCVHCPEPDVDSDDDFDFDEDDNEAA